MSEVNLDMVDRIVQRAGGGRESLIAILHALHEHYHYLPADALRRLSQISSIRLADITGVATFYDRFRLEPAGEHTIRVCTGTACHVKGAPLIEAAVRRHLAIPEDRDTDADRRYTVESVACLGCCTLAPAVQIDHHTYGYMTSDRVGEMMRDFEQRLADEQQSAAKHPAARVTEAEQANGLTEIRIGVGSCCVAKGSGEIVTAIERAAGVYDVPLKIKRVGCVGMCHRTPLLEINTPDSPAMIYADLDPQQAATIIQRHLQPRRWTSRLRNAARRSIDRLVGGNGHTAVQHFRMNERDPKVASFFGPQRHLVTEHFGQLDPIDLDEYVAHDGFAALRRCIESLDGPAIIGEVERSELRGRGGAGFPAARKWRTVQEADAPDKFIICNGDEGDPGAFMDRMLLESFPYRIIEGMAIAARAVGAHHGIFYIRAEYPLAVMRMRQAIENCRASGLLGSNVCDSRWSFDVEVREGAGAFVCGEETALIASLEGRRGQPRLRPPYPAECGFHDLPTLVNNVETLANIPWIIRHGAQAFSAIGSPTSRGTKVFALAGKVQRGGLIEVPMGLTIRQVVEDIGGGVAPGRTFKAVQIGGPSGGCIPAHLADTPIDFEALGELGAIMGSGGLIVLDNTDCMVDIARYFLQFTQDQSCGQCTPCRVGTRRMLDIMDRLVAGEAHPDDLDQLEQLTVSIQQSSLCGLGRTAPNPVLTTLRYFRDEYEAHLSGRCPAGRCRQLVRYHITDDCIGCTLCAQHCPVDAIAMRPYRVHEIDQETCTRCDACRTVCPEDTVIVE